MIRFATMDDCQWISNLVNSSIVRKEYALATLEEQINNKQVIIEDEENAVASFVPYEGYVDVIFNVVETKDNSQTSSSILGTYILHKYRLPFRFHLLKERVEEYWDTKPQYIKNHTKLLNEEEIEGNTYCIYEYTYGGL